VSGVWHIDQGEENDPSALLVNEDFVLMTATNKTPPARQTD
jgi:hypothetical protein